MVKKLGLNRVKELLKHTERSRKDIHCLFLSAFVNNYRDRQKMHKMIRTVVFECRSLRLYQNMQKDAANLMDLLM